MRNLTEEEVQILDDLADPNISADEAEKKRKRLEEIDIEETGGFTWLT